MEDYQRLMGVEAEASGGDDFQCGEAVIDICNLQSKLGLTSDSVGSVTDTALLGGV